MYVWIVIETRRGDSDIESVWPNQKGAEAQVRLILRTKPRPELWGMHGFDLTWTDGIDSIRIVKREMRNPGWMHGAEVVDDKETPK